VRQALIGLEAEEAGRGLRLRGAGEAPWQCSLSLPAAAVLLPGRARFSVAAASSQSGPELPVPRAGPGRAGPEGKGDRDGELGCAEWGLGYTGTGLGWLRCTGAGAGFYWDILGPGLGSTGIYWGRGWVLLGPGTELGGFYWGQGQGYTGFYWGRELVYTGFYRGRELGYTGFYRGRELGYTGFYRGRGLGYTGFHRGWGLGYTGAGDWVLLGDTGFYGDWVLLGDTGFYGDWVLLGYTGFYGDWVLLGYTGFYGDWVILGFTGTGFYWVILGFTGTGFYWVILGSTGAGFYWAVLGRGSASAPAAPGQARGRRRHEALQPERALQGRARRAAAESCPRPRRLQLLPALQVGAGTPSAWGPPSARGPPCAAQRGGSGGAGSSPSPSGAARLASRPRHLAVSIRSRLKPLPTSAPGIPTASGKPV